jgi:ribose transport system ATP-binding protein
MNTQAVLRLQKICKDFSGIRVLHDIDFDLVRGEVHCLVGENGAGKSTLVKIIAGAIRANAGRIFIDNTKIDLRGVGHARSLGICQVYQELMLVPHLSVTENIFLGSEKTRPPLGRMDWKAMERRASEVMAGLGMEVPCRAKIGTLSTAQQQIVEIAKALTFNARILILDEPTDSLTPKNTAALFTVIRGLKARGVSIIYISHRLEEFSHIADRITVLRDGRAMGTHRIQEIGIPEIIRLMVGRDIERAVPVPSTSGAVVLEAHGLCCPPKVRGADFALRAGEITGLAGLVGAGRTELVRLIFGADRPVGGRILLDGKQICIRSPVDAVRMGIGFLTENRKEQGIMPAMSLRANITLATLKRFVRLTRIDKQRERKAAREQMDALSIRAVSTEQAAASLSGGNQQKAILARWLSASCRILIFDEPTRGIDVAAKAEIHKLMRDLARRGTAILMVSSDMPEIMLMSDRILVMARGEIAGELRKEEVTEEKIMALMLAGNNHHAHAA